jgi:hypothetical protein
MAREKWRCVTEYEEGRPVLYFAPKCDACGAEHKVRIKHKGVSPTYAENVLRRAGWDVSSSRLTCDACLDIRKKAAAQRKDLPEGVVLPPPSVTLKSPEEPMSEPLPPLQNLIPETRRRIRDALDEHYLEDKGCYRQAFSDKALGAKLKVPWSWVKEIREALGYGPDVNEQGAEREQELRELRGELKRLEETFLERAGAIETRIKKLEIDASYKAA